MRKLDGLGRRVVKIIEGGDIVCAISDEAIGGTVERQHSSIMRAARSVASECFIFDGENFNHQAVLSLAANATQHDDLLEAAELGSYYRVLCDAVEKLKRVVVVIYDSEGAERDALSMLSRVSGFAKRNGIVFRTILIGDIAEITKKIHYTGMKVDQFIPRNSAESAYDERSEHHFSVSQFSRHA